MSRCPPAERSKQLLVRSGLLHIGDNQLAQVSGNDGQAASRT